MRWRTTRLAIILAFAGASWGIYLYGAAHSPMLEPRIGPRQAYLDRVIREGASDLARERELAERYWTRNPDVAQDRHFGRDGAMGVLGAREHFERHGRREGRVWAGE